MASPSLQPTSEIRLRLTPGHDEVLRNPEVQSALGDVVRTMREQGIEASQRWFTQDAPGAGGWGSGEITLAATLGASVVSAIAAVVGAWLQSRNGRKVKLKVGEIEAEAASMEDLQKLLTKAQEIQQSSEPKKINEP